MGKTRVPRRAPGQRGDPCKSGRGSMAQTHKSPSQACVHYCGSNTGDCPAPPEDKLYGLGVPERVDVRKGGFLPYHPWPWPLGHTLYGDPAVPLLTGHCQAWGQGAGLPALRPMTWLPQGRWDLPPTTAKCRWGCGQGRDGQSERMGKAEQCSPH